MRFTAKLFLTVFIMVAALFGTCHAEVMMQDNTISLEYQFGEEAADKNLMVVVYAPQKTLSDFTEIEGNFKDVVVFAKQIKTDDKGAYSESFKIKYDEADSGEYTVVLSGADLFVTEEFIYTNKLKTAEAVININAHPSDVDYLMNMLKTDSYDLGVDDEYIDDDVAKIAAGLIFDYMEENTLTAENAPSVANKAVAIAALSKGKIENIISEDKIFVLKESSIKDFYKKDYVIESVGRDMTGRISGKSFESFEAFEAAMTEAFVLAVVKNPDGSDNTKSVMQYFAEEIGVSKSGTTAQYEYVSNKDYGSYSDLKTAFENTSSTNNEPSGNKGSGGSFSTGKVSDITFYGEKEAETQTPYPITIFDDLGQVSWAEDAILYLAEKQVINGKGNDKFAPNDEITREEFLKIILNAFELTTDTRAENMFSDVISGSWYEEYVNTAYSLGIVKGYSEDVFGIGEKITRQDMAVMVARAVQKAEIVFAEPTEDTTFDDDSTISDYAKNSVYLLKNAGVINGTGDGSFAPIQNATRAEAAVMIYKVISK
ncbi:MAG: S-layer homology domain-containing protein [Clostridia bacterium]|nr:S-layer homology domain-containing protein [Clostridia bacterium]